MEQWRTPELRVQRVYCAILIILAGLLRTDACDLQGTAVLHKMWFIPDNHRWAACSCKGHCTATEVHLLPQRICHIQTSKTPFKRSHMIALQVRDGGQHGPATRSWHER